MDTVATPTARISRSPHTSIKVLPTTPGASARFPSNIRLVRGPGGPAREVGENVPPPQTQPSAFNEAAPAPMLFSPSSSLVFARRKRSAFKGPMVNTNLSNPGGAVHSPLPGQSAETAEASLKPGRTAARKSQIIEEEDDEFMEEEIEEVDEFDGPEDTGEPGTAVTTEDIQEHPAEDESGTVTTVAEADPEAEAKAEAEAESSSVRKVALEPAPELSSSPVRPPRSSSLRDPPAQATAAIAEVTGTAAVPAEGETADDIPDADVKTPTADPKPADA